MKKISQMFDQWQPSKDIIRIKTLDCHTGGEPLRIIIDGMPEIKGKTILEKRRYCRAELDHIRTALMFEPKGHADMYGAIVVEPEREDSDFGAIFIHNEGYSSMCGHATIALAKFAVECGIVPKTGDSTEVKIDVPCGQIRAIAWGKGDRIENVSFDCVPSYVLYRDKWLELEGAGKIKFDVAFGGAYYAYVNARDIGLECKPEYYSKIIEYGRRIKKAVSEQFVISHPYEKDLSFLYGAIFIDDSDKPELHSRNVCVFADGEVDRSPTGSGVSGRIAIHYARGDVGVGDSICIESIIGTQFKVEAIAEQEYASYSAVIPRVSGTSFISGKSEFMIDPKDPLKNGFILR